MRLRHSIFSFELDDVNKHAFPGGTIVHCVDCGDLAGPWVTTDRGFLCEPCHETPFGWIRSLPQPTTRFARFYYMPPTGAFRAVAIALDKKANVWRILHREFVIKPGEIHRKRGQRETAHEWLVALRSSRTPRAFATLQAAHKAALEEY